MCITCASLLRILVQRVACGVVGPVEIMTSLRKKQFLSKKKILWTAAQLSCIKCVRIDAVFLLMFSQPTRVVVKILVMHMLPTPEAEITDLLFQTELNI